MIIDEIPEGPVVPVGRAGRVLNRHADTLKAMGRRGEIQFAITQSGHWLFDVKGYLARLTKQAANQNERAG